MITYAIWRSQMPDNRAPTQWFKTAQTVEAASDFAAQEKVRRRYFNSGFHCMSLVAVPQGTNPNEGQL